MTRWWVQGSQEGVRKGGCAPFARGNFLNQDPYKCHFLASKMVATCIYQTATFVHIFPIFGDGWWANILFANEWIFSPHPKGKLNKMCYY